MACWSAGWVMVVEGVADDRIIRVESGETALPLGATRRDENTYVYRRERCLRGGTPIMTVDLGARPCYYCPVCHPN